MKKIPFLILSVPFLLLNSFCSQDTTKEEQNNIDSVQESASANKNEAEVSLQLKWVTDTSLTTCESVLYDKDHDILYVSNINKNPDKKDNNGFISKVSTDGAIENLKWVEGLHGPKGMGLLNGKLYVTDITALVEIDVEQGKILKKYEVPGAKFLNDVTIGKDGIVYFSDSQTDRIHSLNNGQLSVWKEGLYAPNGLLALDDKLYLASRDSSFKVIDINTKEATLVATGVGAGDGVVYTGQDGEFIVSNWKGEIFYINNGETQKLLDTKEQNLNTADIELIVDQNLLLVPTFAGNAVHAYEVKK